MVFSFHRTECFPTRCSSPLFLKSLSATVSWANERSWEHINTNDIYILYVEHVKVKPGTLSEENVPTIAAALPKQSSCSRCGFVLTPQNALTSEKLQIATHCIIKLCRYQTQPFVREAHSVFTRYINISRYNFLFVVNFSSLLVKTSPFLSHGYTLLSAPTEQRSDNCLRYLPWRRLGDKALWRNVSIGACHLTQLKSCRMGLCILLSYTSRHFQRSSAPGRVCC